MIKKKFINNKYKCRSDKQRDYILSYGYRIVDEFETTHTKRDQINYLKKNNIPYNEDEIEDKQRNCWVFEADDNLSFLLTEWSNNKPIN